MEEAPVRFELVDINEILKTLPHRYPMLLIDRVINIRTDYSGIGIKNVTFNEPPFLGHFPDRPVYPGVMMIEAMAQTAGVIGIKSVEGTEKPRAVYFLTIDKCKFRKPVMPGDTIEYHMRSIGRRKAMWWFHGDAKVNGYGRRRGRRRRDADGLTGRGARAAASPSQMLTMASDRTDAKHGVTIRHWTAPACRANHRKTLHITSTPWLYRTLR